MIIQPITKQSNNGSSNPPISSGGTRIIQPITTKPVYTPPAPVKSVTQPIKPQANPVVSFFQNAGSAIQQTAQAFTQPKPVISPLPAKPTPTPAFKPLPGGLKITLSDPKAIPSAQVKSQEKAVVVQKVENTFTSAVKKVADVLHAVDTAGGGMPFSELGKTAMQNFSPTGAKISSSQVAPRSEFTSEKEYQQALKEADNGKASQISRALALAIAKPIETVSFGIVKTSNVPKNKLEQAVSTIGSVLPLAAVPPALLVKFTAVSLAFDTALKTVTGKEEVSQLLPQDSPGWVKKGVDILEVLGKAYLAHGIKAGGLRDMFTKQKVEEAGIPKSYYFSPKQVQQSGKLGNEYIKDVLTKAGLTGDEWRVAVKKGAQVELPAEKVITMTDRPYWARIKAFFGQAPSDPQTTIIQPKANVTNIAGLLEAEAGKSYTPQELRNKVFETHLDNTPEGKQLIKATMVAEQQGKDITLDARPEAISAFERNIQDYRSFGGYSVGTSTENAALRDVAIAAQTPEIQAHTKQQVESAIQRGELPVNKDGTITLYRGGNPSSKNALTSATYDKEVAQRFADNAGGVLHEFTVKPEDIKAFIGKAEKEVLVDNKTVKGAEAGLYDTASKYKSAKEFYLRMDDTTRDALRQKGIRGEEAITDYWNKNAVKTEPILDTLNPTGSLYADYSPESRMTMKLGKNITTYDKTAGLKPDDTVTIYRGASKKYTKINPGDFITTKREVAESYTGDKNVLELKVKAKDILDDINEPLGDEYIYRPQVSTSQSKQIGTPISQGRTEAQGPSLKDKPLEMTEKTSFGIRQKSTLVDETNQSISQPSRVAQPSGEPVGTGEKANSRLQERIKEQLLETDAGRYEFDEATGKYNKLNLEQDAKSAVKFLQEKPEEALAVAKGLQDAPQGQTTNAIALAVAFKAREEGNFQLFTDIINKTSLRSTRLGQEIVSLRGQFNQNSPENYIRQVLDRRLNELGKSIVTEAEKAVGKMKAAKQKAMEKIEQETEKLREEIKKRKKKERLIEDVQSFIDELTCK